MVRMTIICNLQWRLYQSLCPEAISGKNVRLRYISILLKYYEMNVIFCIASFFRNSGHVCWKHPSPPPKKKNFEFLCTRWTLRFSWWCLWRVPFSGMLYCSLTDRCQLFGGSCCPHLDGTFALKMKEAIFSKTLAPADQKRDGRFLWTSGTYLSTYMFSQLRIY
jgi:hypothetical protein